MGRALAREDIVYSWMHAPSIWEAWSVIGKRNVVFPSR
jgi:hypothetical protein